LLDGLEYWGIAKELGDFDKQVVEKGIGFA
jgi:hypothetical protein